MTRELETTYSTDSSSSFTSDFLDGLTYSIKVRKFFNRKERRTNIGGKQLGFVLGAIIQWAAAIGSSIYYVNEKYILPSRQTTSNIETQIQNTIR